VTVRAKDNCGVDGGTKGYSQAFVKDRFYILKFLGKMG